MKLEVSRLPGIIQAIRKGKLGRPAYASPETTLHIGRNEQGQYLSIISFPDDKELNWWVVDGGRAMVKERRLDTIVRMQKAWGKRPIFIISGEPETLKTIACCLRYNPKAKYSNDTVKGTTVRAIHEEVGFKLNPTPFDPYDL